MKFTYHLKIKKPSDITNSIPFSVLSKELKLFLQEHNAVQERYYFEDNGFYFFLYLSNGDRIDCQL